MIYGNINDLEFACIE